MAIEWSGKQADLIMAPFDYTLDWLEGTPRSGKTTAGTMRFARHLIRSRDAIHLVTGYSAEQAFRLIMDGDGMGLMHIFEGCCRTSHDDSGAHLLVRLPDGDKKVYWKGGGKADSHKAITGMSIGSVYFCEINLLHDNMVQECFRRTYAAKDRWHIADLNPPSPADPCIKKVLEIQNSRFIHWTCADNPILTPERLGEIEAACKKSPFLYKRDWLGERTIPEGVIYWMFDPGRHILPRFPADLNMVEAFVAGDGGTTDATSIGFYIVGATGNMMFSGPRNYTLYRVGNWRYDGGKMAMSDQAKKIVGEFLPYMRQKYGIRESGIYIDPACKALRLEIEKLGPMTQGADNNAHDIKGSTKGLRVGVEMLQSAFNDDRFFLVEDERYGTEAFVKEAGLYCADEKGSPIDAYNHSCDEVRYAYNYFAKSYGLWG
jgi:PBSX family phage terminase large subunit